MKNIIAILLLSIIVLIITTSIFGVWGFVIFIAIYIAFSFSMILQLEDRIIELENRLNEASAMKKDPEVESPSEEIIE